MTTIDMTPEDDRKPDSVPADPAAPDPDGPMYVDTDAVSEFALAGDELGEVVTEAEIRGGLDSGAGLLAMFLPHPDDMPELWEFTEDELDALAPPLARVVNKRGAAAQRVIQASDEMAVAAHVSFYTIRRMRLLRSLADAAADEAETDIGFGLETDGEAADFVPVQP